MFTNFLFVLVYESHSSCEAATYIAPSSWGINKTHKFAVGDYDPKYISENKKKIHACFLEWVYPQSIQVMTKS